jgi:hypothetical protein
MYRVRIEAKLPTLPFEQWLQKKAMHIFFNKTDDEQFLNEHFIEIAQHPSLPPMITNPISDIEKASAETITEKEVKSLAKLFRRHDN